MAFEIRTGPRGPQALWDHKLLTSSYDPAKEARSWAGGCQAQAGDLVFVAGDPWGLASQALGDRGVRAVALVPGQAALPLVPPGVRSWAPGNDNLEAFLSGVFDEWGPEAVRWEVWPAFERLVPDLALEWSKRFRDHYRTVQGSWLTQRHFGRRFWTNAVRNFLDWDQGLTLVPGDRPLVVAASGPSLDDGLEVLARHRHLFDLWALPSSFETLVQRGLVPDAGVATDGGFYAREHLHCLRGTRVPVLAALGSAPDPVLTQRPCLFFSQGLEIERSLLGALGGYTEVPSQGTVAVTALRLALRSTSGPVYVAGLDLAFRDLRGHTSPHTVDRRLSALHHRLAPWEGLWAQRRIEQAPLVHRGVRTSPAMVTYASWLDAPGRFERTVHRIAPTAVRLGSLAEVDWDQAARAWTAYRGNRPVGWTTPTTWPDREARKLALGRTLDALITRARGGVAPWLVEAARTAVPEALAEDFVTWRAGGSGARCPGALVEFLEALARGGR